MEKWKNNTGKVREFCQSGKVGTMLKDHVTGVHRVSEIDNGLGGKVLEWVLTKVLVFDTLLPISSFDRELHQFFQLKPTKQQEN